jgi:hypothetical protein
MGRPTPRRRLAAAALPILFVAVSVAAVTATTANATNTHHDQHPSVDRTDR